MKRAANPHLSPSGKLALAEYEQRLHEQEDLTPASIRNYLSDVRHFIAWHEQQREAQCQDDASFTPQTITTPTITRYRTYLQTIQRQKPTSVNRSLISLKRYFGWATRHHLITYDPSVGVKLVGQEDSPPHHLDDDEEQALVAAVTERGSLRDRVLIVLLSTRLLARCSVSIFQPCPLVALFSFHQARPRKLCQNVPWAASSKNMLLLLSSQTSAHMICGIALAIAWLKLFPCIDWRNL